MSTAYVKVHICFYDDKGNELNTTQIGGPYIKDALIRLKEDVCKHIDLQDDPQALFEYIIQKDK